MTAAVASLADSAPSLVPEIRPETPQDRGAIEALLDHAFGPGRFAKASERVRELAPLRPDLSFCAWEAGRLVGVVRQSEIAVGGHRLIFLGPLAVDTRARRLGAGAKLVEIACAAAQAAGFGEVLLVGDPPFFGRLGFSAQATGHIVMPGPIDPRRLLLKPLGLAGEGDDLVLQGAVTAP
ncbi:MAG: N-acetyltransferase [Phenylobacterium sp.]|nr:N-acetyltransferase [Phenylobacterium sp.]